MKKKAEYLKADILSIVNNEFKYYPLSNLIDINKLLFQSHFGQGHFIGSDVQAKHHLENELKNMHNPSGPLIQDISHGKGLYRLSLNVIKRGIVPIDDYLSFFLNKEETLIDWQDWSNKWQFVTKILYEYYPHLNDDNLAKQCKEIIRNKAIVSHSECFRLTYRPHYRVMQLSEYEIVKYPAMMEYL